MTDNEIIKALECCSKEDGCPDDCLGRKVGCELEGYALDLINRQKTKIEALQRENMVLRDVIDARDTKIEMLQSKKQQKNLKKSWKERISNERRNKTFKTVFKRHGI